MALLSTAPLLHLIIILTCLFSDHVQPLCHTDESTALLEFKDSFVIDKYASSDPLAYPKVASWTPKEKDNCCSWDGIQCDENNTHVIALHLNSSCLFGSIHSNNSLFRLSYLQSLDLSDNHFNHSQIPPQLCHLSNLRYLDLSGSVLVGQIPLEISQLSNLSHLDLSSNDHLELKRPNLSTLVRNFTKLKHLCLNYVNIYSPVPCLLSNFSTLISLRLSACGLYGKFPDDIFQLPNLQYLDLSDNGNLTGFLPEFRPNNPLKELWLGETGFFGHIPSSIGNLDSLYVLVLQDSWFSGPLPSSLGKLSKLELLSLSYNDFSGTVDFDMFLNMKNLTALALSGNNLSVHIRENSVAQNINATLPKFEVLYLGSCNLTSFPDMLRYQDRLKLLGLSANYIHGKVPKWIWNTSIEQLSMDANLLTGLDIVVLPLRSLRALTISNNRLTGPLPIPPPSLTVFDVSHNELSGEISPLFLNLSSLELLDLSYNKLSGVLPKCLRNIDHNFSRSGSAQMCPFGNQLQVIDLSYNQFQGSLPQSFFANCMKLKVLKLENNRLNDVFPSWLGTLPNLKLLLLRSNQFHGVINSASDNDFPSLQIIDLSHNNFSGSLPLDHFKKSIAMKAFDPRNSSYLRTKINLPLEARWTTYLIVLYSVTITNKGNNMEYQKIQEVFTLIDLSSNRFQGDIPKCIGDFQGVRALNLSNNMLTGSIPISISNMTQLESLDLSRNKLSGEIPQQLVQLTFLAFFNVSFNHLRGLIPQGRQFSTFDGSSYKGNAGLWGYPLQSLNAPKPPPSTQSFEEEDDQDSKSWFKSNWITILPGFFGGLIFGVAIEHLLAMDKCEWFIKVVDFVVFNKTKGSRGEKFRRKN